MYSWYGISSLLMTGLTILGIQRDLITATATISGLASFMFGFLTNLPVALAYVLTIVQRYLLSTI